MSQVLAAQSSSPSSPFPQLDAILRRLAARKDAWVQVTLRERVLLLEACQRGVLAVADRWVAAACQAKRVPLDSGVAGEEWVTGPMTVVRNIRLFVEALRDGGQPRPRSVRRGPGGRSIATVFPRTLLERVAFSGMVAEVWMAPGQPATQGRLYAEKRAGRFGPGRVAFVLGAGNIASIAPLDLLAKLVVEDQVALLKMNPVNEYLAPLIEEAFEPLITAGFAAVVTGGKDVGEYLCRHELVDSIHLTGSDKTHDAIVWGGTPEEQATRKAAGTPALAKAMTSELGCVTPILVVPGRWKASDLRFQARHVASMVAHNASFNCTAGKVLVLASGWPQRDAFLGEVRSALASLPTRWAYYPGALERYASFLAAYPQAEPLGARGEGVVPWTFVRGVPPRKGEYAFETEAFCGVLAETTLEAGDAASYLDRAVPFANEDLWGTLSCVVLADRGAARTLGTRLDRAIAGLRYGNVGLNVWTGANFALGVTSWGAFPGHRVADIGSGIGVVHNTFLFDHPEKSVIRGPFRLRPKPLWFADHRTLAALGPRLVRFEADPTWAKMPAVGWTAFRG
jgi:acyl-CoA reductase-like NAD-dependent aldehyde dehydrogenase